MKVKIFLVEGELGKILPGNKREKSLHGDMEKAINSATELIEKDGGEVVDVRTETDFASMASGGSSLIVLRYKPMSETRKELEDPPVFHEPVKGKKNK